MSVNTGDRVRFVKMSRADYDSLEEKDGATLYFVNETGDFDPTSLGNTGSDGEVFLGDTRLNSANVPSDWNATSGASSISNIPSVLNVEFGIPTNADGGWRKLCDILSEENCLLVIGGTYGNRPSTMAGVAISTNYTSFGMKLLWCTTFSENSRITKLRLVRYEPNASGSGKYKCSLEYYHTGTGSSLERRRFSLFGVGQGFANAATSFPTTPLPEPASPAQIESELSMIESVVTETASYYGKCETVGATAAKTVTIAPSNFRLSTGVKVSVFFTYSNTASSPTLNINGTGAKTIRRYGTTGAGNASWSSWNSGSVVDLVYDGTYWQMVGYNNTTYSTITQNELTNGSSNANRVVTPKLLHDNLMVFGCGYGTCDTNFEATSSVDGTVEMDGYELRDHGMVAVRFLHAVPGGATLNINSTGKKSIYHRGTAITRGVITDGNVAVFMYDSTNRVFNLIAHEVTDDKYELNANKVTSLSSSSTNTQYPSAKCVYDIIGDIETLLAAI